MAVMGRKGATKFKIEGLKEAMAAIDPYIVEKALAVSIQKTLRKTRTQISRDIRKVYASVSLQDVKTAVGLKLHRVSFSPPEFSLRYRGRRISLRKFGARKKRVMSAKGPRWGVEVKVRKDRGYRLIRAHHGYSGGFFGPNEQIYVRTTKDRIPIEKRSGIAIPQMVGTQDTQTQIFKYMKQEMPRQFAVNLEHFVLKAKGKR